MFGNYPRTAYLFLGRRPPSLEGDQCGQRRLRTQISIEARRSQPVAATTGPRVVNPAPLVVAAQEPTCRRLEVGLPYRIGGNGPGTEAGIGHGSRLDGLLVEARPALTGRPSPDRGEAEVPLPGLDLRQPAEPPQAEIQKTTVSEAVSGGDQRFGEPGVVVAEAWLKPNPVVARGSLEETCAPFDQFPGGGVFSLVGEHLGSPQHRERIGSECRGSKSAVLGEQVTRVRPDCRCRAEAGSSSQSPQSPPLGVVRAHRIDP